MKNIFLTALFASVALLPVAADAATQPESFSGMYNPTTFTQYDGVALYGATSGTSFTSLTLPVFTSITLNSNTSLGPATVQVPTAANNLRVAVFSLYGSPTSSTVTLTLDPTYAASITTGGGMAFATAFPGVNEATISTYIQGALTGNTAAATALETFFNTYNADFPLVTDSHATGTLVTFSNAAVGGSAGLNLSPVPEPSAWMMVIAGLAGIAVLQRRRRWA